MTSFMDDGQGNLTKIMRIALVGTKPADQILLKGYLRVLLRLEVDLEWVSASHANVDLFMINNEFKNATSVVRLLENQSHKPILYISRTDTGEGWIKDKQLVLPLKMLHNLNAWLLESVAVLKQGGGAVTDILRKNQPDFKKINAQNTSQSGASHNNNVSNVSLAVIHKNKPSSQPNHSANASNQQLPSRRAQDYQGIITLIQQLQKRPEGLYYMTTNEQTVAIVEPSHARVWLSGHQDDTHWHEPHPQPPKLCLDWQLKPYIGEPLENSKATDLIQYLWQYAWMHPELLLPLVSDDISYQLRYWIKPSLAIANDAHHCRVLSKKDKQGLLSVMTALEFASCNINQLAQSANISIKSAKKIVASLLFSGSLHAENYTQIYVQVSRTATPVPKASVMTAETATGVTALTPTPLDTLLDDVSNINPPTSRTEAQQAKHGFLSLLRKKLGL